MLAQLALQYAGILTTQGPRLGAELAWREVGLSICTCQVGCIFLGFLYFLFQKTSQLGISSPNAVYVANLH